MKSKDCRLTVVKASNGIFGRQLVWREEGALGVSDRDQVVTVWVFHVFFSSGDRGE
jgi:hypothetical protein